MKKIEHVLQIVIRDVVLPILLDLDRESGQSIAVELRAAHLGSIAVAKASTRVHISEDEAKGEIRILLSDGGLPESFKFSAEAILRGLAPDSGFSGFSIRGRGTVEGEGGAKLLARANRYNVWNWGAGFLF